MQKISRCLISVSDKSGVVELAKFLEKNNVEIVSTGGTKKLLQDNDVKVINIDDFTGFPEIMNGRLKTLHPKVHGGLLAMPDNVSHQKQASENDIKSIDLLVVNLYPFVETVKKTNDEGQIIENIDIGGPAMVRSAAKNFAYKAVVTDASQYSELIESLAKNSCSTSPEFRKKLARDAFKNIAEYDAAISDYFCKDDKSENSLPENLSINSALSLGLRYGENSHQKAACYSNSKSGIVNAKQLQGKELSYNNLNDSDAAYNLSMEFDRPTCAIIKHANPCGVATAGDSLEAFKKAFAADSKSAFGGIVAINDVVDEKLAREISKIFFEVIIAKSFSKEALEVLSKKKNLRLLEADFVKGSSLQIKSISGGFLVQQQDYKTITRSDVELATKAKVDESEIDQLIFAMNICKHVKSNAITVVKDFQLKGVGAGQTSRVDSCEIACKKAQDNDSSRGGFLASDAFFPFADNIEIAAKYGIKAVIATKGSIRDQEVVDEANKQGIALYFVETRHFRH